MYNHIHIRKMIDDAIKSAIKEYYGDDEFETLYRHYKPKVERALSNKGLENIWDLQKYINKIVIGS